MALVPGQDRLGMLEEEQATWRIIDTNLRTVRCQVNYIQGVVSLSTKFCPFLVTGVVCHSVSKSLCEIFRQ